MSEGVVRSEGGGQAVHELPRVVRGPAEAQVCTSEMEVEQVVEAHVVVVEYVAEGLGEELGVVRHVVLEERVALLVVGRFIALEQGD